MGTPQQMRIALSEIPDRLEALRFASTPTIADQGSPDDPQPAAIFNQTLWDNTTNVAMSQDQFHSLLPSPDEIVIRQRGRRRITTWTPDKVNNFDGSTRSPFQRTPTKMPLPSSMILRSSPRKRLTMGSTPPDPITFVSASPTKITAKQQLWPGTPAFKKKRLSEHQLPIAQQNGDTPLSVLLLGMSQQQLIDLIVNDLIAGNNHTEHKLRQQLPMPDIDPLEQELMHAKRNIFKSLPTSRLCKKTDSTAYSRAVLHLIEFKRLLTIHTKVLYDSANWDALLDYVTMAWPCVRSTPQWDSVSHNNIRRQCFKLLSCHCITSIKYGNTRLGADRLHTLERNLREWSNDYEEVLSCLNALTKTITKGRASL